MTDHSELPAVQQPVRPLPTDLDRFANAMLGQMTFGLSPVSLAQAYTDWMVHLASSPAKQMELAQRAFSQTHRLALQMLEFKSEPGIPCIEPLPPGQSVQASELAAATFFFHLSVVSSDPAVVAQGHIHRARREPASSRHGHLHSKTVAGHGVSIEFSPHQP